MKWKLKDKRNDRCGISDCGRYMISHYTLSGDDVFKVFCSGQEIGTTSSRDEAKRIAMDHSKRGGA